MTLYIKGETDIHGLIRPDSGYGMDDVSGFLCALTPSNEEHRLNRNKHEL